MFPDFVAQSLKAFQSGGILLGGDDELGTLHGCKGVVDELHILGSKHVVVSKRQRLEMVSKR